MDSKMGYQGHQLELSVPQKSTNLQVLIFGIGITKSGITYDINSWDEHGLL
jgi:hypothetical protein